MKEKFKRAYMKAAQTFAELSHARRLHVGAIVVKDDRIISIGYNGMPAGWDNNCEDIELMDRDAGGWLNPDEIIEKWPLEGKFWVNGEEVDTRYRLVTKPEVLHAETNAIAKLAKSNESGLGATMFITHAPCLDCAKLIYQSGIGNVLYRDAYRDTGGITFLKKSGVIVEQIDE
jgi:dCMP deaminase